MCYTKMTFIIVIIQVKEKVQAFLQSLNKDQNVQNRILNSKFDSDKMKEMVSIPYNIWNLDQTFMTFDLMI